MAGVLPGVKCARRRRLHLGESAAEPPSGLRRPSFCLYASNHKSRLASNTMKSITGMCKASSSSAFLGGTAREAKERLDEKLKFQRKDHSLGGTSGHELEAMGTLQREVFLWKRKRWRWTVKITGGMVGWKARTEEKEECVVCLDQFRTGDAVVKLPCAHRFHWSCVSPWLRVSSSCPCCRTQVKSS